MKGFAIASINPSREELWQIHKSGCKDIAKRNWFKRCIAAVYEVRAENPQAAEEEFIDSELREMGYAPGDGSTRIMPCCKDAVESSVPDVLKGGN